MSDTVLDRDYNGRMIRFTIRQLEYFQSVVETGSATSAAAACHVSQAALSSGIVQLEAAVGVKLFVRQKSRNLSLTPAGRAFGSSVQSLLQQLQELEAGASSFGQEVSGVLRLGCFDTLSPLMLPSMAQHFGQNHPNVTLRFFEGSPENIEADLRAGRCEGIIIYKEHVSPDLEHHGLGTHPLYVALPADHRLAGVKDLQIEQLIGEPYVLLDQMPISAKITKMLNDHGIHSAPLLTSRSIETIRSFVAHGLGFTVTGVRPPSDSSFEGLPIAFKPLDHGSLQREIVLCTMPGSPVSRRLQTAIEYWRDMVSQLAL